MKLWILKPKKNLEKDPWRPWYDKAFGFIVRAENEEDARKLANGQKGHEGDEILDPWLDINFTTCVELTIDGNSEIIMQDFAGA